MWKLPPFCCRSETHYTLALVNPPMVKSCCHSSILVDLLLNLKIIDGEVENEEVLAILVDPLIKYEN